MKELAEDIAKHPGVRAAGKKGEVMSAVDTAVYIKEGLFRCVESCKMTTGPVQDWGVLTLYEKPNVPPTLQELLRTVVSRDEGNGVYIRNVPAAQTRGIEGEPSHRSTDGSQGQQDTVQALHRGEIDGVQLKDGKTVMVGPHWCRVSGVWHEEESLEIKVQWEETNKIWEMKCSLCAKMKTAPCLLSKQQTALGVSSRGYMKPTWEADLKI